MTAYDAPLAIAEFDRLCIKANHLLRTIRTAKDEKTAKEFLSKTRTLAGQSKWTLDEIRGEHEGNYGTRMASKKEKA